MSPAYTMAVPRSPIVRFWSKVRVAPADACWEWLGETRRGYGRFKPDPWHDNGTKVWVHRYAYLLCVGDIPPGYTIDHLCGNTRCVNPVHLEVVTRRTNSRRRHRRGRRGLVG